MPPRREITAESLYRTARVLRKQVADAGPPDRLPGVRDGEPSDGDGLPAVRDQARGGEEGGGRGAAPRRADSDPRGGTRGGGGGARGGGRGRGGPRPRQGDRRRAPRLPPRRDRGPGAGGRGGGGTREGERGADPEARGVRVPDVRGGGLRERGRVP